MPVMAAVLVTAYGGTGPGNGELGSLWYGRFSRSGKGNPRVEPAIDGTGMGAECYVHDVVGGLPKMEGR